MFKRCFQILILFALITTLKASASTAFDALVKAVNERDYTTVNGMLLANTDKSLLKERDRAGRTILHYAAAKGNTDILSLILTYGPEINALDKDGQSPIFYAVNKAYEKNTKMLIESGANVNIANNNKFTPLLLAAQNGKPKLARILLNAGADVNARSVTGASALLYAAARGNTDLIEILLQNRADLKARDKLGNTAMHYAAKNNRNKAVKFFLPLINKRNNAGQTPLDIALLNHGLNSNIVTELVKNGANTGKK